MPTPYSVPPIIQPHAQVCLAAFKYFDFPNSGRFGVWICFVCFLLSRLEVNFLLLINCYWSCDDRLHSIKQSITLHFTQSALNYDLPNKPNLDCLDYTPQKRTLIPACSAHHSGSQHHGHRHCSSNSCSICCSICCERFGRQRVSNRDKTGTWLAHHYCGQHPSKELQLLCQG